MGRGTAGHPLPWSERSLPAPTQALLHLLGHLCALPHHHPGRVHLRHCPRGLLPARGPGFRELEEASPRGGGGFWQISQGGNRVWRYHKDDPSYSGVDTKHHVPSVPERAGVGSRRAPWLRHGVGVVNHRGWGAARSTPSAEQGSPDSASRRCPSPPCQQSWSEAAGQSRSPARHLEEQQKRVFLGCQPLWAHRSFCPEL